MLHIEEQFQVEENKKKQKEKYIMQYIEELEYLLLSVSIVNLLLRAFRFLGCVKSLSNSSPL